VVFVQCFAELVDQLRLRIVEIRYVPVIDGVDDRGIEARRQRQLLVRIPFKTALQCRAVTRMASSESAGPRVVS
jgi:hypothetical protein